MKGTRHSIWTFAISQSDGIVHEGTAFTPANANSRLGSVRGKVSFFTPCRIGARFQYISQACDRELEDKRFIVRFRACFPSNAQVRVLGPEGHGVADATIEALLVDPLHHHREEHDVRANAGDYCRGMTPPRHGADGGYRADPGTRVCRPDSLRHPTHASNRPPELR